VNTNDNTKQNPRCLLQVRAKNTGVEITRAFIRYCKKINKTEENIFPNYV